MILVVFLGLRRWDVSRFTLVIMAVVVTGVILSRIQSTKDYGILLVILAFVIVILNWIFWGKSSL